MEDRVRQLHKDYMSVSAIASFMCLTAEDVDRILSDSDYQLPKPPPKPPRPVKEPKLKPVKPLSTLPTEFQHLPEPEREITRLTLRGLSARKIKERIGLSMGVRNIQHIATKHLGRPREGKNSNFHHLHYLVRPHVEECLRLLGKDPYFCEICEEGQTIKCDIHHTKYEGATVYDLLYVCRSCNLARVNKGLA